MRKPRILREGARYHVMARLTRHEMGLDSKAQKQLLLAVIKRARKKYDFRIENFSIMGNHFHLLIVPGKGQSLSRIMQWIMSVFAMRYNRIHGYWGPAWGSRFISRIVDTFRDLFATFEYINLNSVKAGLVLLPWEWPYCGLHHARDGCLDILGELDPMISALFRTFLP